MKVKNLIIECRTKLFGKTIAISGATGGIGKEICKYLAEFGANLILLDRNYKKSNALIEELCSKYKNLRAKHITMDLEDIYIVNCAIEKLKKESIDVLILNAGAYHIPRYVCKTGFDNVFQINFASQYYIVKKLHNELSEKKIKIIAVSSIAHNYSKINVNDIDFKNVKKSSLVYGNAKRFLTFSLQQLYREKNYLSIVHPGITFTNITNHYSKLIFTLIKHPMKIIFMKPKVAALSILYGAITTTKENEWIGPSIFNIWGLPKKTKLKTCGKTETKQIFEIAEKVYTECEKLT